MNYAETWLLTLAVVAFSLTAFAQHGHGAPAEAWGRASVTVRLAPIMEV